MEKSSPSKAITSQGAEKRERDRSNSSENEERVRAALERARQNVKAKVKQELDAELVGNAILNLRLKSPD